MPEETHNYLINYTTTYTGTGAREAEADVRRIGEAAETTRTRLYGFSEATTTTVTSFREATAAGGDFTEVVRAQPMTLAEAERAAREASEGVSLLRRETQRMVGYSLRYLVRYFLVWQGMRAIGDVVSGMVEGHKELERAILRVQWAMQTTSTEARQYVYGMAGAGVPMAQMAGGALALGPVTTQAARLGQLTGVGAQEAIRAVMDLQRRFNLTDDQTQELIASLGLLWAQFGDLDYVISNFDTLINTIEGGPAALERWNSMWGDFEQTATHTADRVGAAWQDMWAMFGGLWGFVPGQEGIASFLERQASALRFKTLPEEERYRLEQEYLGETGAGIAMRPIWPGDQGMITPEFREWLWQREQQPQTTEGRLGIPPTDITGGLGMQFITGFSGAMQRPEYERFAERVQELQEEWESRGWVGEWAEKSFYVTDKMGSDIEKVKAYAEVIAITNKEMNERMKEATYNWPAGAQGVVIGRGSTGRVAMGQETQVNRPSWQPQPIDWGSDPNYWYYIPGVSPWSQYQHGTREVRETGPAIVHKGEQIIPAGGGGMAGNLTASVNLYLNHRIVAQSVSRWQGDQLLQAQRAAGGHIGAIASM